MLVIVTCHFQDLDDESVLETVDFSEFEALFQVNRYKKNPKLTQREESEFLVANKSVSNTFYCADLKKASEQLCLIESRRARNLGWYIFCMCTIPLLTSMTCTGEFSDCQASDWSHS